MTTLKLEPIFESTAVVILLIAAILAVPWVMPVAGRAVTVYQRRRLQWLRTGTAIVLIFAILRPSIVRTDSMPTEATLAILLDRSRSMTMPATKSLSRSDQQNDLFDKLCTSVGKLDQSLSLKVFSYSAAANELPQDAKTKELLSEPPDGSATDLGKAIDAAIQGSSGKPLAGVVLIGDGVEVLPSTDLANQKGNDAQASARLLASLDVPLWTIAIGPPGDLGQSRDVEVAELPESYGLYSGNETNVDFVIRSRALAGKSSTVRVTLTDEVGEKKPIEIAIRSIVSDKAEDSIPVSIPIVAPAPGRYQMEVRIEPQEGETLLSNNSQVSFVDVRQGGGRVLYLEGQPRLEQAALLQSLRRFPDLQVTYRWIAADTKSKWPIDLGLSQNPDAFDVIVLGDLPADAIGAEQLQWFANRIGDGKALLMIGGLEAFAQGNYQSSPLADVLPVKLDSKLDDLRGDVPLAVSIAHPITAITSSLSFEDQAKAWRALPPLIGANHFSETRVAPGVEVLLETPDSEPILVVGEYGSGRVATFAGDSTWRWQRQGNSTEYRRFWRQMLLWLLNRDSNTSDTLDINLAKRRAELSQPIDFVVTSQGNSKDAAPVLSIVSSDGSEKQFDADVVVQPTDDNGLRLEGKITGLRPGMYRLKAAFPSDRESGTERSFQILDQDGELRQPFADHTFLSQLANQTASSGGAMFLPESIDELTNLITQLRRNAKAPVTQKYRLGDTPSSAWPLFILLSLLLSFEWYMRRRWGLA